MSLQGTSITLERPCKATRIPSGEVLHPNPGETYVVRNGFTLKAELEKASFGDGHAH